MSRFDDFDEFLVSISPSQDADDFLKQTERSVKKAFEVFGDFYKSVLEPRGDFRLIAKKKDNSKRYNLEQVDNPPPIFNYIVFVIPKNPTDWPLKEAGPTVLTDEFDLLDKIIDLDWHPNIVMQFSVEIFPVWDTIKHNHKLIFKPRIEIKSWGETAYDQIQTLIAKPHVGSYGKAWDKTYTIMRLFPDQEFSKEDELELTSALKLAGVNCLNHHNLWFGPRLLANEQVKELT